MLVYGKYILQSERLEVQAITGVVIGGDGFRIAVDHHRLIAIFTQRERRMAAAVIKLNPLPDTVRTTAQDDDLLFLRRRRLVFLLVSRVEIRSVAFEFRSARVHAFIDRRDPVLLAH